MELEIRPEPTDDERDALVQAIERAGLAPQRPAGYDSPWRAAGLRDAANADEPQP